MFIEFEFFINILTFVFNVMLYFFPFFIFMFLCNFNKSTSVMDMDTDVRMDGWSHLNATVQLYLGLCCHLMTRRGKTA